MYKVDLPVDQSIEKAVERRRSAEKARKARIFNTRLRVMGLDLDTLNQQVEEKKHQQNMDRQRDIAFDTLRTYHDDLLLQQDIDEREKRNALHMDLTQYWATHQRVEDSRDADLNCKPNGAISITVREAKLGPASMQIFQGEGFGAEQMKREQMKNTERDLRAQKEDNERRHMGIKHRDLLASKELLHQDLKKVQQAALEEEYKIATRIALDNYNQALAAERAQKLKEQQRREEQENLAEVWHTLTSDMMTECAEAAEGAAGGGRVVTDRWKGMSPEQLSAIQKEREAQCLQRQKQRDAERIQEAAWNFHLLKLSKEEEEEDMKAAKQRRERRIQMDQYNMQLAGEQQAYQEYLNKDLYTNKPTKGYFCQFNTTSR